MWAPCSLLASPSVYGSWLLFRAKLHLKSQQHQGRWNTAMCNGSGHITYLADTRSWSLAHVELLFLFSFVSEFINKIFLSSDLYFPGAYVAKTTVMNVLFWKKTLVDIRRFSRYTIQAEITVKYIVNSLAFSINCQFNRHGGLTPHSVCSSCCSSLLFG